MVAAGFLIDGLWAEPESEVFRNTTGTLGVTALAFAHGLLRALPELDRRHRWAWRATAVPMPSPRGPANG